MNQEPVTYNGYKIFHFGDGFNQTYLFGRSTYQLTNYVATKDDTQAYVYLFAVSTVEAALHNVRLEAGALLEQALNTVKGHLDEGNLTDRQEYTFEYYFEGMVNGFRAVNKPLWAASSPT